MTSSAFLRSPQPSKAREKHMLWQSNAVFESVPMQGVSGVDEKTNLSQTEIAHLCGFFELSHMKRMIKKRNESE